MSVQASERIPSSPEEILSKIEEDVTEMRWEQRSRLFVHAAELFEKKGDCESLQKMGWEIALSNLRTIDYEETKKSGERFVPMVEYTNGNVFPDKRKFSTDQIEYYKERAYLSENPIMTSRYSDIVWELERDYVYAKLAIDKYLECALIYVTNGWLNEVADSLTRAANLSLSINDITKIEEVKNAVIKTMQKLAEFNDFRYCLELTDAMLDMKKYCKVEEYEIIIRIIKDGSVHYKNDVKDGFLLQRSFLHKLVELKNAIDKHEESIQHRREIAQSYEEEAEWKLKNYPQGAGVSASILQNAIKSYAELGDSEKVKELKNKIKERTKRSIAEMRTFVAPIEIPRESIESLINSLLDKTLNNSLSKIAGDDRLIPNITRIRLQTEEQKKIAPIGFLIPRVSIRDDNPVLISKSDEEIFDHHVRQNVARFYQISSSIIGIAINTLVEKNDLNAENLVSFLLSTGIYQEEQINMIRVGLERYFEGDYVSSIHVLIPQLEAVLRQFLGRIGEPTTTYRDGIVQERTLDDILRDAKMEEFLGENIWNYLKVFLVDKIGDNLRNDMAHGLLTVERCTRNAATTIVHLLLVLTRFSS
ncbi:MAG: DUF4209 domain-containing protein [Candidatus Aminicenantes bacterium]|nr:DUF4209 domain-containing protein [Candidatus Aminicenantes bacterium]